MTDLPIPEKALKSHTGILGMTGSGKTTSAKSVIEHIVAEGGRVCILDPIKSDWWGLTSSRSGKADGLPFQILGGPHGHVPLHSGAGKAIGELVARGSLPLSIIDMADFEAGGLQAFFCDFAATLMKRMRGVLHLVIEEAHEFAPKERAGIGKENLAIHFAKKLAIAGRTKGIRLIVLTQRTQALHNAILGSCETMVVHRFISPADQQPVLGWLKGNVKDKDTRQAIEDGLSGLADGEAWVVSGVAKVLERVQFPRPWTYDNTKTPDEEDTEHQVHMAPVDVEGLREAIGDAVVEAEANDPKKLRALIAELEREAKKPREMAVDVELLQRNQLQGYRRGWAECAERARELIVAGAFAELEKVPTPVHGTVDTGTIRPGMRVIDGRGDIRPGATIVAPKLPRNAFSRELAKIGGEALPQGERKILEALIQFPAGRTRSQLMVLTGYAQRSLTTYLPRLMERGFVESNAGVLYATRPGINALPDAAPLPQGAALQAHWRAILPEGERVILDTLLEAGGRPVTREKLQEKTGYAPRSITTYVPRLAAKGLVVTARGELRASESLF